MSKMNKALELIDKQLEALDNKMNNIDILSRSEGHSKRLNRFFEIREKMNGLLTAHYIIQMVEMEDLKNFREDSESDKIRFEELKTYFEHCYDATNDA